MAASDRLSTALLVTRILPLCRLVKQLRVDACIAMPAAPRRGLRDLIAASGVRLRLAGSQGDDSAPPGVIRWLTSIGNWQAAVRRAQSDRFGVIQMTGVDKIAVPASCSDAAVCLPVLLLLLG